MDNENQERISETLDISKPDFVFTPKEVHNWRQQGALLICKSCEIEHGVHIGMGKIMVGINPEGQPIFRSRQIAVNVTR